MVVVDEGLVAVEGEAVVHIALDVLEGDDFFAGGVLGDLLREGAGGVVEVEFMTFRSRRGR